MLFKFRKRSFLNSIYYLFGTEILINYAKKKINRFQAQQKSMHSNQKICICQNDSQPR